VKTYALVHEALFKHTENSWLMPIFTKLGSLQLATLISYLGLPPH